MRLLGLIYFFAFGAFLFQIKGLLGTSGILPIKNYLRLIQERITHPYLKFPTVFWFNSSDQMLLGVVIAGIVLSLLLVAGIAPPLLLALLYILYLSIVTIGQDFLSFGWELFLLEITINAFFLSLSIVPNLWVWISINLLLFRFHFQGGAVKLQSRDPHWRDLTAVAYHYQSQPLPNAIAWFAHKLPMGFQKFSCALMLLIELIVPFALFFSDEWRLGVYFAFVGLQLFIWATGNFSYLNHMTVVLCTILISNSYLPEVLQITPQAIPDELNLFLSIAGGVLILVQLMNLWNHFLIPHSICDRVLHACQPYYFGNRYGIFAIMTTERYEIIIEGSADGVEWKEYACYYKPSEVNRRPRRISPYQPRVDWQMWFLPFRNYGQNFWFQKFLEHLLKGTPEVVQLLRVNPFPDHPPLFIRARVFLYEFTDWKMKAATGLWWKRVLVGNYTPTLMLKSAN